MITDKVGNRIKELRKIEGISQEKLAFKAELDRTYVAGVESGKRNLSIRSLVKNFECIGRVFRKSFLKICNVDYK